MPDRQKHRVKVSSASASASSSCLPSHSPLPTLPDPHHHHHNSLDTPAPVPLTTLSKGSASNSAPHDEPVLLFDAVSTQADHPVHDPDMEPARSGHRRRKSSLLNDVNTNVQHGGARRSPNSRSPVSGHTSSAEESKLGDVDEGHTSDELEMENLSDDGLQDDEETGLTGKDRSRRKRRKRRHTLLDNRIVEEVPITAEEKKEADQNVFKNSLINAGLIGLWYIFSLSISLYNKWMFDPEYLNFNFPLFTTCLHMVVQFSLSALVLLLLPQFRPRYDSISNPHSTYTDDQLLQHETDSKKPLMTKEFYLTRIGPCGTATALDIGLGNMSLKFIKLTFYTMCKSSSLAFVLLFAFLFRLEAPSWRLVAIIATMTVGVILMVAGEVSFSAIGFILVISAAFFSGFRWGLTQILLLRNPATSNPFSSIFYLAPVMFTSLFIIALPVEGVPSLIEGLGLLVTQKGAILGPAILLFPGAIAFCMTASEFALLQRTSVVTLSIAGIFKEVVTISAAALTFGDTLTSINVSGLFVTIGAIAAYNWIKIKKMRDDARVAAHKLREGDEASETEAEEDDHDDDWNEQSYVTSDGDILPNPNYFKVKTPTSAKVDGHSEGIASG